MKVLIALLFVVGLANAEEVTNPVNHRGTQNIQICKSEPAKQKTVYMTYKQEKRIKELEAENARLRKALAEKLKVKRYVRTIDKTKKNSISLLGVYAPTNLKTSQSGGNFNADTDYELAPGLLYQRDFGTLNGSVGASTNGAFMLGVGLGF